MLKKSNEFESKIDGSLLISYKKIRSSVRNGLCCCRCWTGVPLQAHFLLSHHKFNFDIASRKKLITDEHSGRILVDKELADEESLKMEKLFTSL